ncbi:MAG: hypothetical protein WD898_02730 [Candidatus Paceibacterota bacterium]
MANTDLTVEAFILLREMFFDRKGKPKSFKLRDKQNTQDDPLDEYLTATLTSQLVDATCEKSSGPLISPDLVIYRPDLCNTAARASLRDDTQRIVALEVKKLERAETGKIARASGMDYNTTPPCGIVRIYDRTNQPLDVRGFYLFVAQEEVSKTNYIVSALALCDGNVLNEDFDLYLRITSQREKEIGLGTYANGANRNRPMLIFANPLGTPEFDKAATLVSSKNHSETDSRVSLAYTIKRTTSNGEKRVFYALRLRDDLTSDWGKRILLDPFPQPANRVGATQARGKFKVSIQPKDD